FILSQTGRSVMKRSRIAVALGTVALTVLVGSVWADIRLNVPEDIAPSAYTRPDGLSGFIPDVIQGGEWDAIAFYRAPEYVPLDFNLLDWYDASLAALDCPFLLEGFIVWPDPANNGFPRSSELRGLGAVPIWFVKLSELQAAMATGEVTIVDLVSMPSLRIGTATFYQEQLHYYPPAERSFSQIRAAGTF